ncbi:hypothetical protein SAMN05421823_106137 [Catalinimonas alkaloidigena]|uniref:Uncharacterized protein n=1 Tax=Catalinimonas alkaloidigena TaxID=1075417 RepID=A0A1G9KFI6_9BACT|nr:hypothetical protein [Catalinimonas alkaloidigena]SDL48123.1 hypothetical protein SAMN05421823_106137 [Catalinimonas alkaloidigena]
MSACKPVVFINQEGFCISQCSDCKQVGWYYRNLLVGFSERDFVQFSQRLLDLDFTRQSVLFPDGVRYTLIRTCHADIQFCFTEDELATVQKGLANALLLIEVHQMMSDSN